MKHWMPRWLIDSINQTNNDAFVHNRAGHYGYKNNRPVSKHSKKKCKK